MFVVENASNASIRHWSKKKSKRVHRETLAAAASTALLYSLLPSDPGHPQRHLIRHLPTPALHTRPHDDERPRTDRHPDIAPLKPLHQHTDNRLHLRQREFIPNAAPRAAKERHHLAPQRRALELSRFPSVRILDPPIGVERRRVGAPDVRALVGEDVPCVELLALLHGELGEHAAVGERERVREREDVVLLRDERAAGNGRAHAQGLAQDRVEEGQRVEHLRVNLFEPALFGVGFGLHDLRAEAGLDLGMFGEEVESPGEAGG